MKKLFVKIYILILFVFISTQFSYGQERSITYQNLENVVMDYYPPMPEGFDEKKYKKGKYILENTYAAIRSSTNGFVYADYWNIAVGFSYMGEKPEYIEIAFKKAIEKDAQTVCEIILGFNGGKDITKHAFYRSIPETYSNFYSKCKVAKPTPEKTISTSEFAKKNNLDAYLIKTIAQIAEQDQRHRKGSGLHYEDPIRLNKQNELDKQNRELIENLFAKHKRYIGRSLVGKEYEATMWLVIQHSNLEMMERYLPVIQQAVKDGELHITPFKMLIDRIYATKYKYQIFGSQIGVDFADDKTIRAVKKKFEID